MNLFTEKELIIMGSIVLGLIALVLILIILDLVTKRKKKNDLTLIEVQNEDLNTLKIEETVLDKKEDVEVESFVEERLISELDSNQINEETLVQNEEEIESLVMEIEPLVNVVKIETLEESEMDKKEKAQIELLKIEEELEHTFSLEDTITNLEAIEEENAIISYQELLENTGELDKILMDDGDEPITIDEVFNMFNHDKEEVIYQEMEALPLSEAYQGAFEATPYVSPINGLEVESLSAIQLENTANLEKLDREIRKTNEFLNILNELKKNLE